MANLNETAQWETGIYQLETSDPVMGGPDGIDNRQAKQLANRTLWLKNQTEALQTATAGKAASATTVTAGNGLTGGGNLTASRTISLGQPGQITAQSQNAVQSSGHTHAIDTATTSRAGIVMLESSTGSQAEDRAATPKAVNAARAISIPTASTSRAGIVQLADRVSANTAEANKAITTAAVNRAIDELSDNVLGRIGEANTRIDNAVTLTGDQTVTGAKIFQADIKASASTAHAAADRYIRLGADATGAYAVNSNFIFEARRQPHLRRPQRPARTGHQQRRQFERQQQSRIGSRRENRLRCRCCRIRRRAEHGINRQRRRKRLAQAAQRHLDAMGQGDNRGRAPTKRNILHRRFQGNLFNRKFCLFPQCRLLGQHGRQRCDSLLRQE